MLPATYAKGAKMGAEVIPGLLENRSARRHLNGGGAAKARRRFACLVQRLEYDIICA